jgi:DNA-binding beta-propeller fold protein YncE
MLRNTLRHLVPLIVVSSVSVALPTLAWAQITYLDSFGSAGGGNGQFNYPYAVALSPTGQVYVTDSVNQRVQVFTAGGAYVSQFGMAGSGNGQFNGPTGVAVSASGQVYVVDQNNYRVQAFTAAGAYVSQIGSQGSGNGQFLSPSGVGVSGSGQAYVTDFSGNNVQVFTAAGAYASQFGSTGSGNGQFSGPTALAVSDTGQVYITDSGNQRVQVFTAGGAYVSQFGSAGNGNGQFGYPYGVTVSGTGQVYVADFGSDRIQVFTAGGAYVSQFGSHGSGNGQFDGVYGVAVSGTGLVYVADSNNNRVQRFFSPSDWVSGTNTFATATAGPGQLLGPSLTLDPTKGLAVTGATVIQPGGSITVAGGSLTTGTLSVGGSFTLNSGTLTQLGVGTAGATDLTAASGGAITLAGGLVNLGAAGVLQAAAGGGVACTGPAVVAGGFLRGSGQFTVSGGAVFTGASASNSTALNVTGAGSFTNFSNSGTLNLTAGPASPTAFDGFINQGSGAITIGAGSQLNAADFQTYGTLTLSPGSMAAPTQLTNTASSPLFFNGGSRTFISVPANAGQFDAGIDLHGQNAVVAGGLFVNNGYIVDSGPNGKAIIVADFGSLVKGAGFYQNSVQTVNGGRFQSGNSPGKASFGSFIFGPGGVSNYVFAIDDATGAAGPTPDGNGQVSGWGLITAVQRPIGPATTPGDFVWAADLAHPLTVALDTLINPTTVGTDIAGPMADFNPAKQYSWLAAQWAGSYTGPTDPEALKATTTFDVTGFANPIAGAFGWSLDAAGHTLSLTYTPSAVPEPGTLALASVAAAAGVTFWRRRPKSLAETATRRRQNDHDRRTRGWHILWKTSAESPGLVSDGRPSVSRKVTGVRG